MDAAGVLALQRSAGNAAVSQSLEAQRDDHGADHEHAHGLPVQRALTNSDRNYGTTPGTLMRPNMQDQQRLENVFPRDQNRDFQQFPDPVVFGSVLTGPLNAQLQRAQGTGAPVLGGEQEAAPWVQAINPLRHADAYRRNCVDAARSFLASWSGNPTVAVGVHGTTDRDLEADANARTATWLATRWKYDDDQSPSGGSADVWDTVRTRLERVGHGAASVVLFDRPGGAAHAVCGVNHLGSIVWVDAQRGKVKVSDPLYQGTTFLTITLSPQFEAVDAPAPHPTALAPGP
ncbi:toxin glutamine deamidase domain-containing protein [Actinomadura sp. 9N215]|uniref:toxin glutamine deamidase domain-containing protein n=1 Tax=Actinomadura sp. 9N215 TaxID=3375150 RepID=UPI0037B67CF4